jgi:hypothetical protein
MTRKLPTLRLLSHARVLSLQNSINETSLSNSCRAESSSETSLSIKVDREEAIMANPIKVHSYGQKRDRSTTKSRDLFSGELWTMFEDEERHDGIGPLKSNVTSDLFPRRQSLSRGPYKEEPSTACRDDFDLRAKNHSAQGSTIATRHIRLGHSPYSRGKGSLNNLSHSDSCPDLLCASPTGNKSKSHRKCQGSLDFELRSWTRAITRTGQANDASEPKDLHCARNSDADDKDGSSYSFALQRLISGRAKVLAESQRRYGSTATGATKTGAKRPAPVQSFETRLNDDSDERYALRILVAVVFAAGVVTVWAISQTF